MSQVRFQGERGQVLVDACPECREVRTVDAEHGYHVKKAAEMCGNCIYWEPRPQTCRRYPQQVPKRGDEWCGEWLDRY